MLIDRCRRLAQNHPRRVVFPDALDKRVLEAAHYLLHHGLAQPILLANPFALRHFALSHRFTLGAKPIYALPEISHQRLRYYVQDYGLSGFKREPKRCHRFF